MDKDQAIFFMIFIFFVLPMAFHLLEKISTKEVFCKNCHHYGGGNKCKAPKNLIKINKYDSVKYRSIKKCSVLNKSNDCELYSKSQYYEL